jgi:hypothetical protein
MHEKITDGSANVFEDLGLDNADELLRKANREIEAAKKKADKPARNCPSGGE